MAFSGAWSFTETAVTSAGSPVRVGATFHVVQGSGLSKVEFDHETVDLIDGQKVVLRSETKSLISVDTITVAAFTGGSTVTYDVEITLEGVRRIVEAVFGLVLKGIGTQARDGLQKQLS